ncbi:UNVERIFIED_CONTAM: hypothetical protein K2H54_021598 [Gekko kuhli]
MWCSGSNSQPVLSQPPSASVSPGNTTKLPCVLGSGYSIGTYRVYWYQQKSTNSPRFILHYKSDSDKGQGSVAFPRFSASKDTSSNSFYLIITGVQAEDEADYYCLTAYSSGSSWK